jgi:hypothetical protein
VRCCAGNRVKNKSAAKCGQKKRSARLSPGA